MSPNVNNEAMKRARAKAVKAGQLRKRDTLKKKYFKAILDEIAKGGIFTIVDARAAVGMKQTSFYSYFPAESEERKAIDDALFVAKRRTIRGITAKLYNSDNPNSQIALLKLLATPEERLALSNSPAAAVVVANNNGGTSRDERMLNWWEAFQDTMKLSVSAEQPADLVHRRSLPTSEDSASRFVVE